jgi:WD40 repeat protein
MHHHHQEAATTTISTSTTANTTAIIRSPISRYEGHTDACIAAEWFPDGDCLVTASWDRTANVYNVETTKLLCQLQHDDYLTNVNIHKTQKIILTSSKDTTFKVWDFRDAIRSVNVYQGHSRSVNSAIFCGDDKIATSSDDQTVKLWDLRIMRSPVSTINLNAGANRLCSFEQTAETFLAIPLDNRDIKIYNLAGERMMRLPRTNRIGHRRLVTSVASHGNLLLSASFDKTVSCWSIDYSPHIKSNSYSSSNNKLTFHQQSHFNKENGELAVTSSSSGHPAENGGKLVQSPNSNLNTPLTLITNNSTISTIAPTAVNTLAKLTERIKI